jgi:hypothetical protein
VQEIETASEEDDEGEAAGGCECDVGATDVEETKEKGSVACYGEKEEGAPKKGLNEMQQ